MSECIRCEAPLEWPKDEPVTLGKHVIACPVCGIGNIVFVYSGKGIIQDTKMAQHRPDLNPFYEAGSQGAGHAR